jgi:SAM-dependent methyltransferase
MANKIFPEKVSTERWQAAQQWEQQHWVGAQTDQSAAESLYNEYQAEFSEAELEKIRNNILRRCRQVDMPFDRQKRVLDVGCGSGYVLNAVCDQFDCEDRGIDVDKRRIALARSRARRAEFECGLFDPAQLGRPYDVILFNAVLEHVVDPMGFLQQLNAALAGQDDFPRGRRLPEKFHFAEPAFGRPPADPGGRQQAQCFQEQSRRAPPSGPERPIDAGKVPQRKNQLQLQGLHEFNSHRSARVPGFLAAMPPATKQNHARHRPGRCFPSGRGPSRLTRP